MLTATDTGPVAAAILAPPPIVSPAPASQPLDPAIATAMAARSYTPSPGFAGTPEQAATAATIAGLAPNSPEWVAAVTAANANGGILPSPDAVPARGGFAPVAPMLSVPPPPDAVSAAMPANWTGFGLPAGAGSPASWSLVIGAPGSRGGYGRGYATEPAHLAASAQAVRASSSRAPAGFGSRLAGTLHSIGTGGQRRRATRTPLTP